MKTRIQKDIWAGIYLLVIGVIYVIEILFGIMTADKNTNYIIPTVKIIMEFTTIVSSFLFFLFFSRILVSIGEEFSSLLKFFIFSLILLTCTVHFIGITLTNQ